MMTKIKKWLIALLFGSVCLASVLTFEIDKIPDDLKLKCSKDKILFSRDIDWKIEKADGSIEDKGIGKEYLYISNKEIPQADGEYISKRTKNAQFFKKGENKWQAKFYNGKPFYKDEKNNKWYQTETAITTVKMFERQTGDTIFEKFSGLFIRKTIADSASYYSSAGDGPVSYSYDTNWNTIHDATTGSYSGGTATGQLCGGSGYSGASGGYYISRGFLPIDTSGLPDDAVISNADLKLYVYIIAYDDNDAQAYLAVVQTDQPSNTVLTTADYNNCGATDDPAKGSSDFSLSDIVDDTYNTWTLNATGEGWISKTGYTKLGMREGHDIEDNPFMASNGNNRILVRFSEYADTTYDPYLEITYTTGAPAERRIINIH